MTFSTSLITGSATGFKDERWSSLNPAGFNYGSGGWSVQHLPWTGALTDKYPGFLNHYSTSAPEEDKAEVFANLILNEEYVRCRMQSDPVLRAKVKLLKERLAKFCPELDDGFWARARRVKRNN
jgi:hypothetical protein